MADPKADEQAPITVRRQARLRKRRRAERDLQVQDAPGRSGRQGLASRDGDRWQRILTPDGPA